MLAQDALNCVVGPCVALESIAGRSSCGLVRNPLGYMFRAAHPDSDVDVLAPALDIANGHQLSVEIAAALGVGSGCDARDSGETAKWPWKV